MLERISIIKHGIRATEAKRIIAELAIGQGARLTLRLPETFPSWHLLQELARAFSATHDGESDGHGPVFVGLYVQLLTRYLRLDHDALISSLAAAGIRVAAKAIPVFINSTWAWTASLFAARHSTSQGHARRLPFC